LNEFTTEIDGQTIYFIHERSHLPNAIPLMLIHGWPGSIVEFLELIQPLTQPTDSKMPAFDVVIPSLPGFGFSGPTTTPGWNPDRMAKALILLMDRLARILALWCAGGRLGFYYSARYSPRCA
jgi:pimeloyl-ACP methyl ester carboxylesterase